MYVEVLQAGLQTSVQDDGRPGYMHLGVAKGGAMDTFSMQLANWLVGNPPNQAVLEICLTGPSLRFSHGVSVAIAGAKFELCIISQAGKQSLVNVEQTIQLNAGDTLIFAKRLQGARAYLAVAAQFACCSVLGSLATHFSAKFGGFDGRALQKGDKLFLRDAKLQKIKTLASELVQQYSGNYVLRCVPGVETNQFSEAQQTAFFNTRYSLRSDSNRVGLRFAGQPLDLHSMQDMISSGLTQGSVQIPPSGLPIVSSVDGQTIGGYPRIANVISADLFALGQIAPGDKVRFSLVSAEHAQNLYARNQTRRFE